MAVTSGGRPKRRTRRLVDYRETESDTAAALEGYLERVRREAEVRSVASYTRHQRAVLVSIQTPS